MVQPDGEITSRRSQMLLAAYEIVGKKGLEALHARSVAEVVQVNHATVHYYFPKRIDLLVGLCRALENRFDLDFKNVAQEAKTARDRIEARAVLFEAYCRPTSRFIKVFNALSVAAVDEPQVHNAVNLMLTKWMNDLRTDCVVASNDLGKADWAMARARMFLATAFGLMTFAHLDPNPESTEKAFEEVLNGTL